MALGCPGITTTKTPYCPAHKALGFYGTAWRRRQAEHLALEPTCRRCGQAAEMADHIQPRSQGGTDEHDNLQSLCLSCHGNKTWTLG